MSEQPKNTRVGISVVNGKVVLLWPSPIQTVEFEPHQAINIGYEIAKRGAQILGMREEVK